MEPLNPQTVRTRARLNSWHVRIYQLPNGPGLILTRDHWQIQIVFHGIKASQATILKPGNNRHEDLDVNLIYRWLQASSAQMREFSIGDRVLVGTNPGRPGKVTNIFPHPDDRDARARNVRLVVAYDDGGQGQPFATYAHHLEAA